MKKISLFLSVFSLAVIIVSTEVISDRVDFSMVEEGIRWLELVREGGGKSSKKKFFDQNVRPTSGADSIQQYWNGMTTGGIPDLNDYFYQLLTKREPGKKWKTGVLTREWYRRSRKLLRRVYKDPPFYRKLLNKLKVHDIGGEALALATQYLPETDLKDIRIEFILFGHSMAFSVKNRCVYDFLQVPADEKGNIKTDEMIRVLAHEIHHLGFIRSTEAAMRGVVNTEKLSLVWMLASEGIPTWYIDKPYTQIGQFLNRKDRLYREMALDWVRHSKNLKNLYREAESEIVLALQGKLSFSAVSWKWNEGVKGAVYVLGSHMVSVIHQYLGEGAVLDVIRDYRKLIRIYNKAAILGNRSEGEFFVFSGAVADSVARFRE